MVLCICENTDGHISESLKHIIIVWKLINLTLEVQFVTTLTCFIHLLYTVSLT
jgi:hypothetical protein